MTGNPGLGIGAPTDIAERFAVAVRHHQAGRLADAENLYRQILAIAPGHADSLHLLGIISQQSGRGDAAVDLVRQAIALRGSEPRFHHNLGNILQEQGALDDAEASFRKALTLKFDYPEAHYNLGNVLIKLGRPVDALDAYANALAVRPSYLEAHYNRGNAFAQLRRFHEALVCYDRALALTPNLPELLVNRANVLLEMGRFDDALQGYDRALALKPDYADALNNRGNALMDLKRPEAAFESYNKALALNPNFANVVGLADAAFASCNWSLTGRMEGDLKARVLAGNSTVNPFTFLACCDDPPLHLRCARDYIHARLPVRPPALWNGELFRNDKIRLTYLSSDFQEHATTQLMVELFERHDRTRFEIIGVSFGLDDGSDLRRRVETAFDEFHDLQARSDHEIASFLHERRIDIAIDLKGHTRDARPGILASRPAPIQVNYLGFPGTMGAEFIDYIVADRIVTPFDQQPFYAEKIVHLPNSYQANGHNREIAPRRATRQEEGLTNDAFVFCCFNNNFKITKPVFTVWMRLLKAVPGSVLWLLRDNDDAERNLRGEAASLGIDPARLVFANRVKMDKHLARHRLADLFLDTLPYNAHTTASDALWMGLPLVTCQGTAFAGRVAASLLRAVGLDELVTHTLEDYEALAFGLAIDRSRLDEVRRKLGGNRLVYSLFDGTRFTRDIESAYAEMWKIWQRGEAPRNFAIDGS